MQEIGTIDVNGVQCEVSASIHGQWYIRDFDSKEGLGSGDSLDEARIKARAAINKKKIKYEAPFVTRDGKPGFVYGTHSRTEKMLIDVNGKKDQEAQSFRVFKPDVDEATIEHYRDLNDSAAELRRKIGDIERTWCVSIFELAQTAIKEVITAQAVKDALGETD